MFAEGRGVAQSDEEAGKWWRKAADQGNVQAQYSLGLMFAEGRGVAQSDEEAGKWWRKAADQGHATAQLSFGALLRIAAAWHRLFSMERVPGKYRYRSPLSRGNTEVKLTTYHCCELPFYHAQPSLFLLTLTSA